MEFGSIIILLLLLGVCFPFFSEGKMWNMEWGFCFGVRGALAMSRFFLGGEMGLWVAFRVSLWARGGEGSGM